MSSARAKAEQAQMAALKANSDAEKARTKARDYDPNFLQPGRSRLLSIVLLLISLTQPIVKEATYEDKTSPQLIINLIIMIFLFVLCNHSEIELYLYISIYI